MHTFLKSFRSRYLFIGIDKKTLQRSFKIDSGDIRLDVLSDTTLLKYKML